MHRFAPLKPFGAQTSVAVALLITATSISSVETTANEATDSQKQKRYEEIQARMLSEGGYIAFAWEWGGPRKTKASDYASYFHRLRQIGFRGSNLRYSGDKPLFTGPRDWRYPHYIEAFTGALLVGNNAREVARKVKAFGQSPDPIEAKFKLLARHPCFSDPDFIARSYRKLEAVAAESASARPLFYSFGAEVGLGPHGHNSPYCYSPHCLHAFRSWLKETYGTIEALNRQWEMQFPSFEKVIPLTTREIADRVKETKRDNFAPWLDHRRFMDTVMPRFYKGCQDAIGKHDPEAAGGLLMVRMAPAQTGWDLWLASKHMRMIEHNDINYHGDEIELIRSFGGPDGFWFRIHELEYGGLYDIYHVWRRMLHGYNGAVKFKGDKLLDRNDVPGYQTIQHGQELEAPYHHLGKGIAAQLHQALQADDRAIRILYSQTSRHTRWAQEGWRSHARLYGDHSSRNHYDDDLSLHAGEAWCHLLEDSGHQYRYISYEQLAENKLDGCRLLILPECEALSKEECEAINRFVNQGGTIVADCLTATMDEHGTRLKEGGRLDELFGIKRESPGALRILKTKLRPPGTGEYHGRIGPLYPHHLSSKTGDQVRSTGTSFQDVTFNTNGALNSVPLVEDGILFKDDVTCLAANDTAQGFAVRAHGKGKAIFLNLRLIVYRFSDPYPDFRYTEKGDGARDITRTVLSLAQLKAPLKITHQQGLSVAPNEVFTFADTAHGSGATITAIVPNYHFSGCPLPNGKKSVRIDGESLKFAPYTAKIQWQNPSPGFAFDMISGKTVATEKGHAVTIHPSEAVMISRLPYQVKKVELRIGAHKDEEQTLDVAVKLHAKTETFAPHIISIELHDKDGRLIRTTFVRTDKNGMATSKGLSTLPPKWRQEIIGTPAVVRVKARDVLTSAVGEWKP